jgi:hypothetical protein
MTICPSSVPFGACFVYAPRGAGAVSAAARVLCRRVKTGDPLWTPRYAGCVVQLWLRGAHFQRVFSQDATLVPVPGSTPASCSASWTAWQLATAFRELGLARGIWTALARRTPVTKSATAAVGRRPTVWQHYDSMSVGPAPSPQPQKIVLIDDVITKGRTLLAAAARLRASLPSIDVRAFALVRTQGFLSRADRLLDPCEGFVYWAGGDARREP